MVSLKILAPADARSEGRPASEVILCAARDAGLTRTAVSRRATGWRRALACVFGRTDVGPVVVEILDTREKLDAFLPRLRQILPDAIVSFEAVELWTPLKVID